MSKVIIETGIPLPHGRNAKGRRVVYPELYTMAVGESFAVPKTDFIRLSNAANHCRRRTGRQFAMKTQGDTCRVWLIEEGAR